MAKRHRLRLAFALAGIALLLLPTLAWAHERRTLGDYELVVGWVGEPAYVDEPNQVDFRVTKTQTSEPVEGLERTVKVEISYGGQTKTADLRPRFGQKGAYVADIMPTRIGDYIFRFTGDINGMPLDARFDSADGQFSKSEAKTEVAFPEAPVGIAQLQDRVAGVSTSTEAAQASAQTALLVGLGGVVLGLLGLILGAIAFVSARRQGAGARRPQWAEPERT